MVSGTSACLEAHAVKQREGHVDGALQSERVACHHHPMQE